MGFAAAVDDLRTNHKLCGAHGHFERLAQIGQRGIGDVGQGDGLEACALAAAVGRGLEAQLSVLKGCRKLHGLIDAHVEGLGAFAEVAGRGGQGIVDAFEHGEALALLAVDVALNHNRGKLAHNRVADSELGCEHDARTARKIVFRNLHEDIGSEAAVGHGLDVARTGADGELALLRGAGAEAEHGRKGGGCVDLLFHTPVLLEDVDEGDGGLGGTDIILVAVFATLHAGDSRTLLIP